MPVIISIEFHYDEEANEILTVITIILNLLILKLVLTK